MKLYIMQVSPLT